MTKVSVLFNLRVSGCKLRDNYCVSFTQLFKKTKLPLYRHFSVLSPIAGFLSLVRVTQFFQFEKVFCVLNHKYIKWKCFLGGYFMTIKPYI